MEYTEIKPLKKLVSFVHSFWKLKGDGLDNQ